MATDKIEAGLLRMLEQRFEGEEYWKHYDESGNNIANAIERYLENRVGADNVSVLSDTLFESCGYACGYVSAAWIRDGKMYHSTFAYEER